MIAAGGLLIVMIIGMYFLTSFDPDHDLSWWVTSGLNRMLFPGVIILWLGIIGAYRDFLSSTTYNNKTVLQRQEPACNQFLR
jgi:hypothetical protein